MLKLEAAFIKESPRVTQVIGAARKLKRTLCSIICPAATTFMQVIELQHRSKPVHIAMHRI